MKIYPRLITVIIVLFGLGLSAPLLASRDYPPRVSQVDGTASYEQAGNTTWDEVTVNLPLLTGDRIYAQADSRVELDLGRANFLRLGPETDLAVGDITGRELRMQLHAGSLVLRVNDSERFRIQTLLGDVLIRKKGLYRVNVDPSGLVEVVVRRGKAEVETGAGKRDVNNGELLRLDNQGRREIAYGYYEDNLDLWSDRQDSRYYTSRSVAYVGGTYYPGVWDLDYYGQWVYYPSYGRVWVPSVSVGWVPFRHGRWGYYSFGWTWISYEPWGWLPYHYGNWVYHHSRWCWVPGGFHTWSPAVVNFYYGNGYVGWTPRYWGRNYTNNTVIINNNTTIINEHERRGLTVIRNDDFGRTRRVTEVAVNRPEREFSDRLRAGLPDDLRDPVASRNRTLVRNEGAGRRDLSNRGNALVGGTTERPSVGRNGLVSPTRDVNRVRVGDRAEGEAGSPTRGSITDRSRTREETRTTAPERVTRPDTRTYRVPDSTSPRSVERPAAPGRSSGDAGSYRAPATAPPRQAPTRRTEPAPAPDGSSRELRSVQPSGPRSVAPAERRSVAPPAPRSVAPSGPRSVAPSGPRSVTPSSPRSVTPAAPRSVAPSAPRSVSPPTRPSEPPRQRESAPQTVRPSTSRDTAPVSRSWAPSQRQSRPAPAISRSGPSVSRPSGPSVSRPAPSVSRPAPAVSRPAPSISRSAPSVSRPSVSRPAPSRGSAPASRPATSRPDRH